MLEFVIRDNILKIPNSWDELTSEQYIEFSKLMIKFESGCLSVTDITQQWITYLLDINVNKVSYKHADTIAMNIAFIANNINFFYYYDYGDALKAMSTTNIKRLRKTDPFLLPDEPEIIYARRCNYSLKVDCIINRNMLPYINGIKGWEADEIKASVFLVVSDLIRLLKANPKVIYDIIELLYPGHKGWSKDLNPEIMYAAVFAFQGYSRFLLGSKKFNILFNRTGTGKSSNADGIEDLYAMCRNGYGSVSDIENISIVQYFTLLLGELRNTVNTLKSRDKSITEISNILNLSIDQIIELC